MKLYRPVGLQELQKILNFESEKFPDRQVWQPILYIVENYGYAEQIATAWNLKDENSGFSGYILEFIIADDYIKDYDLKQVGDKTHMEYWIPAEDTENFNKNISGKIKIINAFYGERYKGVSFDGTVLEGKTPEEQAGELIFLMENSREKFQEIIKTNKIPVILNLIYWMRMVNINESEKNRFISETEKILLEISGNYNDIMIDMNSWKKDRCGEQQ